MTSVHNISSYLCHVVGETPQRAACFHASTVRRTKAFAIAILGIIQTVAVGRAIAVHTGQQIDGNQELIGQGLRLVQNRVARQGRHLPVYTAVRDYQGGLGPVLANYGFAPVMDHAKMVKQMAQHGFQPVAEQRGDQVDITLGACPFETTALVDPDTVCGLHLGIAFGAADSLVGLVIDELIPRDPRRGQCRLRCHVER